MQRVAELNRVPFDFPESESELVSGYHVEYSGFRFAFFMLTEYMYMFAMSALITVLFLGGWLPLPFLDFIPGAVWFALKFSVVVFHLVVAARHVSTCARRSINGIWLEGIATSRFSQYFLNRYC